jgi:nitroreductase/NAD-dependent dihydropyrimidine dehydrogenase PreA subunit
MSLFEINRKTCTKCGLCSTDCPAGLILQREDNFPEPLEHFERECIRCRHCIAICPTGSLNHSEMMAKDCPSIKPGLQPSLEQVTQLIRARRSVRNYQNKPVPREVITKAIEIARYSPTGHNDQDVNWLIIDSPHQRLKMSALGAEWLRFMIKNQPKMSALFNFPNMVKEFESGHDKVFRDAPAIIMTYSRKDSPMSTINCTCAMAYFDLAAQALGLGCCWCGFGLLTATTFPPMMEYLQIPSDQRFFGCILVGFPKYKYQRLPERKYPSILWR